jgi:multicomponent Na+:H+ antiporter subunit B
MRKFFVFSVILSLIILLAFAYFVKITPHNANHYPLATEMYDGSANIVSAIYLNFRLYDTLFELLIFSVAVTGVSFYARRIKENGEIGTDKSVLIRFELLVFGVIIVGWGAYTAVTGHIQPGGAFSGGAIGASGIVILTMALGSVKVHALTEKMKLEFLENLVIFVMLAYVVFGNVQGGFFTPGFSVGKIGEFFSGRGAILLNSSIGFKVFVGGWIVFYEFSKRKESM